MKPTYLHAFTKPSRTEFVTMVRGEGARLYDTEGREYIDGMASLWYCNIGHGRKDMADAIAAQVVKLESYNNFDPFSTDVTDRLTDKLHALSPIPNNRVFLCSSGSESVDTAMKLARLAHVQAGQPERTIIISRGRGYHGSNFGGTSAQGLPLNKIGYDPLVPDVTQVDPDDIEALSVAMSRDGSRIAAVLVEPVQGAGGVFPPTDGYLQGLRKLCDQHGAFLIFDEVISGFGRLGTWFAAQRYGVVPDFTCFAKAVTSGYVPLGGVFVGSAPLRALEADPAFVLRTGYTYSGHATACAAALKNLDIIADEGLVERATHVGDLVSSALHALHRDGVLREVRGDGAVWAAGLHGHHDAQVVRDIAMRNGAIVRGIGAETNAFCPPLVATDAEIGRLMDAYASALHEHVKTVGA
ncbi:MAG: aspartate aminotransferase family protein [Ilumatobacteraceae bacterium]